MQMRFKEERWGSREVELFLPASATIWEWLLRKKSFQKAMSRTGYYEIPKTELASRFREWKSELRKHSRYYPSQHDKPDNLSLGGLVDRMSQIPKALARQDFFVVSGGRSTTLVFDSRRFASPYMSLGKYRNSVKQLQTRFSISKRYSKHILDAFRSQWNEASFIKALHFCGAFAALSEKISGAAQYCSGPSGSLPLKFPFWMMRRSTSSLRGFVYDGTVDLDECIYPLSRDGRREQIIIPIEAKASHIDDLGWHKLAFPSNRFVVQKGDNGILFRAGDGELRSRILNKYSNKTDERIVREIVPVYCAADQYERAAYVYVFKKLVPRTGPLGYGSSSARGFVLNDQSQLVPKQVYKVDLSWIYGLE